MTMGGAGATDDLAQYPCYSLDTSALISLKLHYPHRLFPSVWSFVGRLADERRMLVCRDVVDEARDTDLQDFLGRHAQMVLEFAVFQTHFRRLIVELADSNLLLADPNSDRDSADPHVVAIALMLEGRDPFDLRLGADERRRCTVLTYERRRLRGGGRPRIPDVCDHYSLNCCMWTAFFEAEGFVA